MIQKRKVAVLLFDEVEVLDFAVPFEVLSVAGRRNELDLFDVFGVGTPSVSIRARNSLFLTTRTSIRECHDASVLIVPGGYGTREQLSNPETLEWVRTMASKCEIVMSVCTGSLLLAAAGLLRGRRATTHRGALELLTQLEPQCTVVSERVVDTGTIITTAGVSAGLDGALHLLQRLTNLEMALECAEYIEYDWRPPRRDDSYAPRPSP
jgi:transcriptional regulator GlxA family with amidase domain